MVRFYDMFSGCGGMALGLEQAGLEPVALVDNNRDCARTLRANRPEWPVYDCDITDDYPLFDKGAPS